jgi:hypothetical protein
MPDNDAPKKPTIDERLEAIAQSLELVATMQRDNERQFNERFAKIAHALEQDGENIRALVRIAEAHQRRIERLEDQQ